MADEEMDDESDENLDDELDETSDESGDDTDRSKTSEEETDQSDDESDSTSTDESDDESDDDESKDESGKSEKRTPEQIAKYERKRRKKAERELRELKRPDRSDTDVNTSDTKLPPKGIAERFWKSIVKVDIAEIAVDDPTVHQRAGLIKKIIFDEMPELQKRENGVAVANDIAKGRMMKSTSENGEQSSIVKRKTSPTQPRKPAASDDAFKPKSQSEVNKMSSEQLQEYEDKLGDYYVEHPESRGKQ